MHQKLLRYIDMSLINHIIHLSLSLLAKLLENFTWMDTLKNDLAWHNLTLEDAIELALNKPLWRLLAASGATH